MEIYTDTILPDENFFLSEFVLGWHFVMTAVTKFLGELTPSSVEHFPRTYSPGHFPPDVSLPENRKVGRSPTHCVSLHMLASKGYGTSQKLSNVQGRSLIKVKVNIFYIFRGTVK